MTIKGQTWLVLNEASGSYDEARRQALLDGLAHAGHAPERIVDCAREELPGIADLDAAYVALLVIHGGDGTLNSAIGRLDGWGGTVLALPGGTANLLCKALHGDADLDEILAALASGRLAVTRRQCVRGKGWTALAEVLAGPGANWADVRENLRDGNVVDVMTGTLDATAASTSGPMVAMERPMIGRMEGYAGIRLVPEKTGMVVDGYGAMELGDYLKQAAAILGGDFRAGPHDELGVHRRIICRMTDDTPVPLMIDGEKREGLPHEECALADLAVHLLGLSHG